MTVHLDVRESETEGEERLVGSDRVLAVLAELATHPEGVRLEELARAVGSPKPTVHRALASLRRAGFAAKTAAGTTCSATSTCGWHSPTTRRVPTTAVQGI